MTEANTIKNAAFTVVGLARLESGAQAIAVSVFASDGSGNNNLFTPEAALWLAKQLTDAVYREMQQLDPLALLRGDIQTLQARCDVIQNLIVERVPKPEPKVSRKRKVG